MNMSISHNDEFESIADRLRQIRRDRRLSQEAFATQLEIPVRTYMTWERGEAKVPISIVRKLNLDFAIDLGWLVYGGADENGQRGFTDWSRFKSLAASVEEIVRSLSLRPLAAVELLEIVKSIYDGPAQYDERALIVVRESLAKRGGNI
jgi:transcriptional regulator with XRE-family HTH domain